MYSVPGRTVRIAVRITGLTLHIFTGACLAAILIPARVITPRLTTRVRAGLARWWLRRVGRLLGIRVLRHGRQALSPVLYVVNHISWLDIIAMADVVSADFIAKQEVRGWPVFGWLAEAGGTLFVRRGDSGAARRMEQQMTFRLAAHRNLVLFPEGTTTAGDVPGPFRPRLFQAAIRTRAQVQPVALSYEVSASLRSRIAFLGEQGLLENLWSLLGAHSITVRICLMPALASEAADARTLANAAWVSVCEALESGRNKTLPAAAA